MTAWDPMISILSSPRPTASLRKSSSNDTLSYMKAIPWLEPSSADRESVERSNSIAFLIHSISNILVIEPAVPVSRNCSAPPALPVVDSKLCKMYPDGLTGEVRKNGPVKIGHMVLFSFEVDVLEVHLNELYDVVDHFFILESTRTNLDAVPKPLIWEKIRHQPRFRKFANKIVHFVMDDIDFDSKTSSGSGGIWRQEGLQEAFRFDKFLEWNENQKDPYSDSDMIGFGDTDEVAYRNNVWLLKHCTPKNDMTDIGIWFPWVTLTSALRTDFPASSSYPFTLGDPTFYTLAKAKAVKESGKSPSRNRGYSGNFLLGGMHMTRAPSLPYMILETLTCTECTMWYSEEFAKKVSDVTLNSRTIDELVDWWRNWHVQAQPPNRSVPVSDLSEKDRNDIVRIPWFLQCNMDRYPYWEGRHDHRLDVYPPRY
jgi:hypothetical protein